MADPSYIDADGVLTDPEPWVGIAHATLSLPAATVTWTSTNDGQTGDFSQYMDLVVVVYCKTDGAGAYEYCKLYVNNRTGANDYFYQHLTGDGTTVSAYADDTSNLGGFWYPPGTGGSHEANAFGACVYHMLDVNSGKYKSGTHMAGSYGATNDQVEHHTWMTYTQAPVTEIDLNAGGSSFVAGSTFSLFGVLPRMVTA